MSSDKVRKIVMLCTVGTSLGSHLDGNNWKERTDMNSEKLEDFLKGIFKEPDIPDLAKNIMDKPGFSLKDGEKGLLNIVKANGICKDAFVMENLISAEVQSTLGHINRQTRILSSEKSQKDRIGMTQSMRFSWGSFSGFR